MTDTNNARINENNDKVINLFNYINELNKLKRKIIVNSNEYSFSYNICDIPKDEKHITISYRDRDTNEDMISGDASLLAVHKAEFEKGPEIPECLKEWIDGDWGDFHCKAGYRQKITREYIIHPIETNELTPEMEAEQYKELFSDEASRIQQYDEYIARRKVWQERQLHIERVRELFSCLYRLNIELDRDADTLELIVANGFIMDKNHLNINHPVLTRRVGIEYNPEKNIVYVKDLDVTSELYSEVFQEMGNINLSSIRKYSDELKQEDYHPLDRNSIPDYLKRLVNDLSAESLFVDDEIIPDDWKKHNRFLMRMNPCLILRKRLDGTIKAIEQIVENIEEVGFVPDPIIDIVSGGKIDLKDYSGEEALEEQLAAVGGESTEILLTKEANKEQLEIARRIENHNAVLVQGPPGTGKTHTIANLLGHFLAQGRSVLVTSHTKKALSVLKEKIDPNLQSLCVSVLDDSNKDMERSVDGITTFMSQVQASDLEKQIKELAIQRDFIMKQLAETRRKLFQIIHQECNTIVVNGKDVSPSEAAKYVCDNADVLSYIPGKVNTDVSLPLTLQELADLYSSNADITLEEEKILLKSLPDPSILLTPESFEQYCEIIKNVEKDCQERLQVLQAELKEEGLGDVYCLKTLTKEYEFVAKDETPFVDLKEYCNRFEVFDSWMKAVIIDGKRKGSYRQRWERLIEYIEQLCAFKEESIIRTFGKNVQVSDSIEVAELSRQLQSLRDKIKESGKIPKFSMMFSKGLKEVYNTTFINGKNLESADDCTVVLDYLEERKLRKECEAYWDAIFTMQDVPRFADLDSEEPERIAENYIKPIKRCLDWHANEYDLLKKKVIAIGIRPEALFGFNELDSDNSKIDKIASAVENVLPNICDLACWSLRKKTALTILSEVERKVFEGKNISISLCAQLLNDIVEHNSDLYSEHYYELEALYSKYDIQHKREGLLKQLELYAYDWADAIRFRKGIHGKETVPSRIEDAWKWKQYESIINDLLATSYPQLQKQSLDYSKQYREVTAEYAAKTAWYHLLKNTEADRDIKQALIGWSQTVKRIGKGTGKNAPKYKAKARELMAKCQKAVPAWIMPIGKALETLDPKENRFDIVIIDEASQSDISSLAILYMGKKLIIVGDDKQVSPMAIGVDINQINDLQRMYIADRIPNAHLYDGKTSIYDIAATSFYSLMLREHFRCAPEIIGFSNMLSYDYKIKPLRDASDCPIKPSVVNYRVKNGYRGDKKINEMEAKTIVALIQSCMENSEYDGKTFGIISLLGDEQVKLIQRYIYEQIDEKDIQCRRILCGNASNFQGDERDIIFLSLVDSGDENGPLRLQSYGSDDSTRKRYNVAFSRARDQVWVVHSLDVATDLKPEDIRKTLLDYATSPSALSNIQDEIKKKVESPFEESVAMALTNKNYKLIPQKKVGAYRLDLVVTSKGQSVVIECDGERFHSGEDKIREDMERQTILERLGWRFIRIRGSEYYRNPDKTIERVVAELKTYGIEPEMETFSNEMQVDTDLLNRVKLRASQILNGNNTMKEEIANAEIKEEKATWESEEQENLSEKVVAIGEPTIDDPNEEILSDDSVIDFLVQSKVLYYDERAEGGALWLVGGIELVGIVKECLNRGVYFEHKKEGIYGLESWKSR